MNWKLTAAVTAVAVVLCTLVAAFIYSPTMALDAFLTAARQKDRAGIDRVYDFPAVRRSTRDQLLAHLAREIDANPLAKTDPDTKAENYIPQIDAALEASLNADAIIASMDGEKIKGGLPRASELFQVSFLTPSSVRATFRHPAADDGVTAYYLTWQGLASWRIVRTDFSRAALDDIIKIKSEMVPGP